jgi:hypothetical protein
MYCSQTPGIIQTPWQGSDKSGVDDEVFLLGAPHMLLAPPNYISSAKICHVIAITMVVDLRMAPLRFKPFHLKHQRLRDL